MSDIINIGTKPGARSGAKGWPADRPDDYTRKVKQYALADARIAVSLIPGVWSNDEAETVEGSAHGVAAFDAMLGKFPICDGWATEVYKKPKHQWPQQALEYQRPAIKFNVERMGDGVLCMDDMGLGKTVETILALQFSPWNKMLKVILVPARLRQQWGSEIRKWAEGDVLVNGLAVLPEPSERARLGQLKRKAPPNYKVSKAGWVVASYNDAEEVKKTVGHEYAQYVLVVDEVHNIRGLKPARTLKLRGLASFAAGRLGLTGSPLYTDVARAYAALDVIQPGGFGSYVDFTRRYMGGHDGEHGWEVGEKETYPAELRARLSYFAYRRTRADVASQLPFEAKYLIEWVDVPVERVAGRGDAAWFAHLRSLAWLKNKYVVEDVVESGLPTLVFTYLVAHAEALAAAMPGSLLVTGEVPADRRTKLIESYLTRCTAEKKVPVLVGTMDAIGEGLNLQWAKAVTFAALDYSAEKVRQCIARAVRLGQAGTVPVKFIVARRSADQLLLDEMLARLRESRAVLGTESDKQALEAALQPKAAMDKLAAMWAAAEKEESP